MLDIREAPTAEEKHDALERVLASATFARCDQLKHFVRYVTEQEILGQADEGITEYLIGVRALGRRESFVPTEDSSVRSRAHALRKKLEEFYREESPDAPVRIQLPKGSYVPRFLRLETENLLPVAFASTSILESPAAPPGPGQSFHVPHILTFGLGVVCTCLCFWFFRHSMAHEAIRLDMPAVMKEAWGPLLARDADAMLVVATPAQLFLRDYGDQPRPLDPVWAPDLPQNAELSNWFSKAEPATARNRLLLHPNLNSPLWGDAAAAQEAGRTLESYGIPHTLFRERLLKPYMLRGRNVLLFGRAEYSQAIRLKMRGLPFQIEYNGDRRSYVISNHQARKGEPSFYEPAPGEDNLERDVYGLITVLPSDSAGATSTRTVIFSGLTSAGSQAAAEFFSHAQSLSDLRARFRKEGLRSWPASYQVVIQVRTDQTLPLRFSYQNHRVL